MTLADELRTMASEIEPDDTHEELDPRAVQLRALADRAEVLEKDAERYRWLRSPQNECNVEIAGDNDGYDLPGYADALDTAIDAAIAKEPKP